MVLESPFALNLRIGISVLVGTGAGCLACLVAGRDGAEGAAIGTFVVAGVLLGSYIVFPAHPGDRRS